MGITAILIVLLIITIFLVSKIPKLTLFKKVLIVLAVLLLFIGGVTGFESGRRPNLQEVEIAQEIQNENKGNSKKGNSNQKIVVKDSLNEVMSEKDILFNGKLPRYFMVKEFEKTFGKVDSTKLLAEEEPCTFIFDTEPQTGSMNDNKYFTKTVRDLKILKKK
ncbi:hypothetical protein [Chryseobacterium sp. 3008163]|uniref:hypothetical protein n=1 Tax=Chryseobacterium sp. 3008163 TaxID=2478663 RepID=UPI000F0D195D|nr:hypothetical protein [Chryseobacterium sp. 3008163]AYN01721.1 hypothetical protein EAG08_16695 [Chryseobacterium sp. 3008163]